MHHENAQDQAPPDVVERAARVLWEDARQEYDYAWEPNAESFRELARKVLAAAMPATTTEWGVRYEADRDTEVYEARESEAEARAQVAVSPTDTALVSREVTEWREVTP